MNSAQSILQAFERKSGGGRPIEGRDLSRVYAGLARLPSAPAFPGPAMTPVVPLSGLGSAPHIGVIVETRRLDALFFVIANFIEQTGLPVHALLGGGNLDYKDAPPLAGYIADGLLAVSRIEADGLAAPAYNALFLSDPLWAAHADFGKMVVFQTDSCVCPASPFGLEDFTGFDYIGADWGMARPIGLVLDGGVGGFSLRDIAKSRLCLRRFDPQSWPGGEDGYFAFHMELLGGNVARYPDRIKFCVQWNFEARSFACHAVDSMPPEQRAAFFEYCPEAKFLNGSR